MRPKVHDTPLQLKVSHQLMADIRKGASRKGMSLSEFVRDALRREIDAIPVASAPALLGTPANAPDLIPNEAMGSALAKVVADAARGDLESLRALFADRFDALQVNCNLGSQVPAAHLIATAGELITLGRLVISHGHRVDMRAFAGALILAADAFNGVGDHRTTAYLRTQSLAALDQLAEIGDDLAAVSIDKLSKDWPSDVTRMARDLRRLVREEEVA